MLSISPTREVHGSVALPPNPDYFVLAGATALAAGTPCSIEPVEDTPLVRLWCERLAEVLTIERETTRLRLTPRADAGSAVLRLPYERLPLRDFVVFAALAAGRTVRFESLPPQRLSYWTALASQLQCGLAATPGGDGVDLRLDLRSESSVPQVGVSADSLHAALGFALGARRSVALELDFPVATPLRNLLPAFGWELGVRALSERASDPIARRILRMKGKLVTTAAGTFALNADFSTPPAALAQVSLPGDHVLAAVLMAAKSIVQRGNLVIENMPLEPWAGAMLQFLRRAGCAPGLQVTRRTSFGQTGMVTLQRFEPGARKVECLPAWQFSGQLASMVAVSLFTEEESVFRRLDDLRRDDPDGVAQLLSVLSLLGAHHGELPDGLVVKGAAQYDGFDCPQSLPADLAGACVAMALRCIGRSTIDDTRLLERWPGFDTLIASLCQSKG